MKRRRLGIDSKLYFNSAWDWITETGYGTAPDYSAATWAVCDRIEDLVLGTDWNIAPGGDRGQGIDVGAKTRAKAPLTGKLRVDDTDPGFQAFWDAFLVRDSTIDLLVLNGPKDDDGAIGFRGLFIVGGFAENQGADMVLYRDLVAQPAIVNASTPFLHVKVVGGNLVYTPAFTPPA